MNKKNKARGWIKLYRSMQENPIWQSSEPFDDRSAWIDMLLMANHEQTEVSTRSGVVTIEAGSFLTSILKLSERWRWSRHKVSDYLNKLQKGHQVEQKRDVSYTLIKIINWQFYQDNEPKTGHKQDTNGTPNGTQTGHLPYAYKTSEIAPCRDNDSKTGHQRDIKRDTDGTSTGHEQEERNKKKNFYIPKPNRFNQFSERDRSVKDYADIERRKLNGG